MTPKVLTISNECFSKMSSNGRTLGNFFVGWPKEALAQFFLAGTPDFDYCENFYQVSDKQALKAFSGRTCGKCIVKSETSDNKVTTNTAKAKRIKRNALTMLIRNLTWRMSPWKGKGYWKWVDEYNPDVVLLQAGDSAFMYDLAVNTAKRTSAKLIIYNSEAYYFKEYDYFRGHGIEHLLYPMFLRGLEKSLKRAYEYAYCEIYNCDELKQEYTKEFKGYSETVFTGSQTKPIENNNANATFRVSYCGNLGLKRYESLIDVATVLHSISKDAFLDVYGKAGSQEVVDSLNNCEGLHYHGIVSYEEVQNIIEQSDLVLHVESFDPFYRKDIRFGFSTKIADCLSSGQCLLVYAPVELACLQYARKNQVAYTASTKEELRGIISELIINPLSRTKYRDAALALAKENHDATKNSKKFQEILRKSVL